MSSRPSWPTIDLAEERMLHEVLQSRGIRRAIIGAHSQVRNLLHRDDVAELVGGVERDMTRQVVLASAGTA